jgi:hypothetical protein
MINSGQIPVIPGNMMALAGHAAAISRTGTEFAGTGERVDTTWQGLAPVYEAPEATQLFAATGPVRTVSASTGEDITAVGAALTTYALEVAEIQRQLESLRVLAADFVQSVAGVDDWQADPGKVERNNSLLAAVNAQVAAFMEAQRRCANTINALYGGQQYRAEDGDGQVQPGEYGYTAEQLNAAGTDGGLPWGSPERVDRDLLGDVLAVFGGFGGAAVQAAVDLGTLVSRDPVTGEWGNWSAAGEAWTGLGTLAVAVSVYSNPITAAIDQNFGLPFFERGQLGETLVNTGKGIVAYDQWDDDPARAGGAAAFNIISAVVGTKGAGAALRGGGAAAAAVRGGAVAARVSSGLIRAGQFLDRIPTVTELAARVGQRFSIQLPQLGPVPAIVGDVPGGGRIEVEMPAPRGPDVSHVDPGPRVDPGPAPGSVGDALARNVDTPPAPDGGAPDGGAPDGPRAPDGDSPQGDGVDPDTSGADTGTGDPAAGGATGADPQAAPTHTDPGGEYAPGVDGDPPAATSGRPEWLDDRLAGGNEFNSRREPYYEAQGGANEVHVEPRSAAGQYPRVDSYVPGEAIVSRKNTELGQVQASTVRSYLREFAAKYPEGAVIADTPTNRRDLGAERIGQPMIGQMYLEVPVQRGDVPPSIIEFADDLGIKIRDENGRVYELPE